jgi:hypothetical protein
VLSSHHRVNLRISRARITKRTVDSLRPTDKDSYVWDLELAGFGVKITPTGRKVYLVQYRIGGRKGRCRRVTIGPHGPLTPDQARAEARRLLGAVAVGQDPAGARDCRDSRSHRRWNAS